MASVTTLAKLLTPPEAGARLRVKPARIISWIRSGRLRGINLAEPGSQRPRFRVDPIDLQVFLNSRAVTPPAKPGRRRRNPHVTSYF